MARTKKAKGGGGETDFDHDGAMLAVFREGVPPPVVSDVAQTQQSAPGHVGADVPASRQMAPGSPNSSSLPCATPVRHYPRQEPSALAAHAGICAGDVG
jgi:hypothetical protein